MFSETKISKGFQTIIPSKIRKKMNIQAGDRMKWKLTENTLTIEFNKEVTFEDIYGIIDENSELNAVQIKKRIQRGEKY
jgi:AbrB family looped-hinge helix DNA binding protein